MPVSCFTSLTTTYFSSSTGSFFPDGNIHSKPDLSRFRRTTKTSPSRTATPTQTSNRAASALSSNFELESSRLIREASRIPVRSSSDSSASLALRSRNSLSSPAPFGSAMIPISSVAKCMGERARSASRSITAAASVIQIFPGVVIGSIRAAKIIDLPVRRPACVNGSSPRKYSPWCTDRRMSSGGRP